MNGDAPAPIGKLDSGIIAPPTGGTEAVALLKTSEAGPASAFSYDSLSVLTALPIVLPVIDLGTDSPGARVTGLPTPAEAGIGFTDIFSSAAGVSGKEPGTELESSFGKSPTIFAVVASGPTVEIAAAAGGSVMSWGCRTLLAMPLVSVSVALESSVIHLSSTMNCVEIKVRSGNIEEARNGRWREKAGQQPQMTEAKAAMLVELGDEPALRDGKGDGFEW